MTSGREFSRYGENGFGSAWISHYVDNFQQKTREKIKQFWHAYACMLRIYGFSAEIVENVKKTRTWRSF